MSTENTKQSLYATFAANFNELIGYTGEKAGRKARTVAANILEVDYEKVRGWSKGLYLPQSDALLNISEKYPQINLDWLLTGRGPKYHITPPYPHGDLPTKPMPPELRAVYPELEYVFSSKNVGVKQALSFNIKEFKESVIKDEKADKRDVQIASLEERVNELMGKIEQQEKLSTIKQLTGTE